VDEIARIRQEYESRARTIPADFYAWHREEIQYWQATVARVCTRLLRDAQALPLTDLNIADIGCGTGQWLLEFVQWGAAPDNLYGIDLMENRISQARERIPQSDLHCGDARILPWPDGSMDLVTQFTVFSSIQEEAVQKAVASEMLRVLKPGGNVLWYDCRYSNPSRAAVRGLNRDAIRHLFPGCSIRFATTTLVPALSRVIARRSWAIAAALECLPFARTHLAALISPVSPPD
jgi:ubiquinone/menaquinone biosynthesis C-methylase UbiE